MSFGGYNPGRQQDLPFSNAGGAPPQGSTATMRSRTGSFSSNPAPPPPSQQPQQQQQQHGSPYLSQPPVLTSRGSGGEGFYSGVGLNIHTAGYGHNNNNNRNNAGYGSGPNSPVTMSSPYSTGGVRGVSTVLPAHSRRNTGGVGGGGNASGLDDGGYSSGYDSPSGISTSVPYSFNTSNGLHRPHPQHPQPHLQQHLQQHVSSYQQQQATTSTRQSTQRYYPRTHSRRNSNASETSLNIDTGADTTLYSPGPASLSSASSSRRGSFSDVPGGGGAANGIGGFFARQRTYRPSATCAVSDADDDLDMDLGNKNSPRRHRQKRMIKKSTSNRNLLGAVGGMGGGGGKSSSSRMSGILNDWDLLLPTGDPYEDMDEDDGGDDGMNENERWKMKQLTRRGWESRKGQGIILGLIITVAIFVRIWKLAVPGAVVSEEQHLGGYIRDYLQGNFVVDVHPPLGKILFSLVAYLLGYDGKFDFMSGKLYPSNVPFIGMRLFSAACGAALIPVSYLTIKRSGHSTQAAITCAILVTFENALITQNRFMTLDAPMMLFMGYTLLAWVNFYNHRNRPFTRGWWTWLLQTGVGLFLSSSVKWVGSFTIVTIGLCVLRYLQESRKHLYLSTRDFSKQITALSLCLLVLPVLLYMGLYAIDFQLLSKSGLGDYWVSPQFRMTLKGHDVEPVMADIAWQSKIHIRHANSNGGWVHSTPGEYARDGTIDQAIQLVEWDDDLTCWQVHPSDAAIRDRQTQNYIDREKDPSATIAFEGYIYDGDLVRLRHCYTNVALSVYDLESVGSNKSFIKEVRGVRWGKEADVKDREETIWRVELVPEGAVPGLVTTTAKQQPVAGEDTDRIQREQWHSIKGFRLFNEQQNCYLMSHKVFRATYSSYQEVGCIKDNRQKGDTIFVVDRNVNPHLPASTPSHSYQPLTFLQKFIEINRVMWWSHHDLTSPIHFNSHPSTDDYSPTAKGGSKTRKSDASHPWSWLFLSRGLNYYSSKETNHYVYLLGNPIVWWAASTTAVSYVLGCVWSVLGFLRGKSKSQNQKQPRARFGLTPFYTIAPGTFCAGWFIHYAPYFFLSSSSSTSFFSATYGSHLYLHNYLPALYFSILLLISRLDRTWQTWSSRKLRYTIGFIFVLLAVLAWYSLSPLAYGTDFSSRRTCEQTRSIGGWEFLCKRENLPLARPQDAIARVVVEERKDHEEHEEREEEENSRFYYQEPSRDYEHHEHDHEHHDHEGGVHDEGAEHDHEGPFNENEREHYDHEHFHHPPGHQHADAHDHGHHHHGHGHAIHNPVSEHHHHDHPIVPSQKLEVGKDDNENGADSKKASSTKQDRMEKMWAAAAQNAANLQKEKLVAEKLALEARQRELEEQLKVQEQIDLMQKELERQRMVKAKEEEEERERDERRLKDQEALEQVRRAQEERERERQVQEEELEKQELLKREEQERVQREDQERLQREAQDQQERLQREEQERLQREEQERLQREEQERLQREEQERLQREEQERSQREEQERSQREEQERSQREEQERSQREEQERSQREEQERQQREEQERQQREEQERQQREEQERQQREEQERQQREEQERQQREEQERQQREEQERQQREEQERQQREDQERQQREEQLRLEQEAQRLQHQQLQEQEQKEERERLERQANEQAAAAAAETEKKIEEEEAVKEKMTRQMLEEQVRILQAQVDSHHARSLNMAQQPDPHQQQHQQQAQQPV